MPGFVEPHVHLDKTLSLESGELENHSGTLSEAIERWNVSEPGRDHSDFERRADDALRRALSRGVTALRTHVNVSSRNMLPVEALLAVRERWRGRIDVQLVALGLPGSPAEDAAYAEALRLGVDIIGGSPNHAPDPHAAIRSAFANWPSVSAPPSTCTSTRTKTLARATSKVSPNTPSRRGWEGGSAPITAARCRTWVRKTSAESSGRWPRAA